MAFFRIKRIKGKEYCYSVENEWKRKSSRQRVKQYIGRAYRFSISNDISFSEYLKISDLNSYIENNEKSRIIKDLINWELSRFDISKEKFLIDIEEAKIQKNKKNIVFFIDDGFMCGITLKKLLEFAPEGDEQSDGYRLARAFIEAGIKVPQEIFIGLFGKLYGHHKPDSSKLI
ncbi:hypothetical protein HYS31_06170 [Candidatus Woesearchaeota archaeon]|nr:hypothetical protein [Candidatus Woesearchaeota archaeon]